MDLKKEKKRKILKDAIERSHLRGMGDVYNTLCASCSTESYELLDRNHAYRGFHRLGAMLQIVPMVPRTYLWLRGLVPFGTLRHNPTPNLEAEFAHLDEAHPEWAERKERESAQAAADRAAFQQANPGRLRGVISAGCALMGRLWPGD